MTHEDKIIEEFTKPQIIVDKFGKKIGESQWSPYCIEQLRQALTTYRTQVLEEKWGELQRHTIKEPAQNMTDWIDWNDVCKVFNKETALELRIKEKEEELALLKAKLHPTN